MAGDVIPLGASRADLQELVEQIKAVIYERAGRMTTIEAIGVLEVVKLEIWRDET